MDTPDACVELEGHALQPSEEQMYSVGDLHGSRRTTPPAVVDDQHS